MRQRSLRAYADVALGRQRSPQHEDGPHMVPYLRAANVDDGTLDLSDVKEMNFTPPEQEVYRLRTGDVLVTEGSGSLSTVGASAVWNGDVGGVVCFQNTLLRMRPRSTTDPRFLAWWSRHAYDDGLYASLSTGANIYHLSAERVRSIPVSYPDVPTQRAIADFLDAETARIGALISRKRRLQELSDERWRTITERRMNTLAGECGTVPLRRLVECLDYRRIPINSEERSQRSGPYPYYGSSGVVDHVDQYLFDEQIVLLGEDGAQLADPQSRIARTVEGKCWVNNHAHVLRPRNVDATFLELHLNTFDRSPFISGSTREKITQDAMNSIPVPNISLAQQVSERRSLERVIQAADRLTDSIDRQIDLLEERRRALITAAVTGQMAVPGTEAA